MKHYKIIFYLKKCLLESCQIKETSHSIFWSQYEDNLFTLMLNSIITNEGKETQLEDKVLEKV